jgi:hypothetical protein
MESDAKGPDGHFNNPPEDSDDEGDGARPDDEDDGDDDDGDDDHSGSTAYTTLGPESEHPVTPEHMTNLEKLFSALNVRPRNSGSGAVGTPKRELQGTVDTKAYVSDSSLNNPSHKHSNTQFNGRGSGSCDLHLERHRRWCSHVCTRSPCPPPKRKEMGS